MTKPKAAYTGSMPEFYEQYMVPLHFGWHGKVLAERLADLTASEVLEIAAGTGAVTRALAAILPASVGITATDLNQPMLDVAASHTGLGRVRWRQADAMTLPFEDRAFDAVICQFGVMFFPNKRTAFAEAWRVLKPGGRFVFNVWDRLDRNVLNDVGQPSHSV